MAVYYYSLSEMAALIYQTKASINSHLYQKGKVRRGSVAVSVQVTVSQPLGGIMIGMNN